jgi:hypothetical protein
MEGNANDLINNIAVEYTYSSKIRAGKKNFLPALAHNLETKISCRPTEYFCAKSACA